MEKLKASAKFDDYKKRKAEEQRARRQKKKAEENVLPLAQLSEKLQKRRLDDRERKLKSRTKQKIEKIAATVTKKSVEPKQCYSTNATLGKAVTKVKKSLPKSPTKQHAVLSKLLDDV